LTVFDVRELPTHGGSLRVFARRTDGAAGKAREAEHPRVAELLAHENHAGMSNAAFYRAFQAECLRIKNDLLSFLIAAKARGQTVAAYGAAAKGNTLLNFAGIRGDLLRFVVDKNPAKQGKFLPGSRIPIVEEDRLTEDRPDYVLILPWNLLNEVKTQLAYVKAWNAKFVVAVPGLEFS
jgi:hypothetical protein